MIKTIIFIAGLSLFHLACHAQITAVTGTGDEVILYDNHTWKYANKTDTETAAIQTNKTNFKKSSSSGFEVSSNIVNNVKIYINPKKWTFKKGEEGSSAEYNFTHVGKNEAYGMIISERVQIPLLSLRDLALKNASNAAPDIKVVNEEYRNVNGTQVLFIQFTGTISGMNFTYFNYYYSCERGTIQLLTYTFTNLANENKPEMEELLNGLVINY